MFTHYLSGIVFFSISQVFDCDFNQQLGYGLGTDKVHEGGKTVFDLETLTDLKDDAIVNDNHCFGCTAGMGSS